jgi:hypothetical protein
VLLCHRPIVSPSAPVLSTSSAADRAEHATMPLLVWGGPGVGGPSAGARLIVV